MRPQIVKIIFLVCLFVTATPMLGQSSSVSQGPPEPSRGPTLPELPLDDNIIVLVISAIVYGVFVAYRKQVATNIPQ